MYVQLYIGRRWFIVCFTMNYRQGIAREEKGTAFSGQDCVWLQPEQLLCTLLGMGCFAAQVL